MVVGVNPTDYCDPTITGQEMPAETNSVVGVGGVGGPPGLACYADQTPILSRTECCHWISQSRWAGLWPELDLYKLMQYSTARCCLVTTPYYGTRMGSFTSKTPSPVMEPSSITRDSVRGLRRVLHVRFALVISCSLVWMLWKTVVSLLTRSPMGVS